MSSRRREIEEAIFQTERDIEGLSVAIDALYTLCHASGSSAGNTLAGAGAFDLGRVDVTLHEGGERELAAAWRRVTELGHQRAELKRSLQSLRDQLAQIPQRPVRLCGVCGSQLDDERSTRAFCSNACRQKAYRQRVA